MRRVDVDAAVEVEVALQGRQRRVRVAEGQVPEAGPGRVAALDHAAHLARRPGGGVAVLGQVPGAEGVLVVAHAVGEAHAGVPLVGQEEIVIVDGAEVGAALFVEDHVVEADAVALGEDVELADGVRLVAGVAESLRHGRQAGHGLGRLEDPVAVSARRCARHQGAPRRDADRAFAVGVGEAGAAAGQLVEGGGEDGRVAGFPEEGSGPVVGGDQEHVRSVVCHRGLLIPRCTAADAGGRRCRPGQEALRGGPLRATGPGAARGSCRRRGSWTGGGR